MCFYRIFYRRSAARASVPGAGPCAGAPPSPILLPKDPLSACAATAVSAGGSTIFISVARLNGHCFATSGYVQRASSAAIRASSRMRMSSPPGSILQISLSFAHVRNRQILDVQVRRLQGAIPFHAASISDWDRRCTESAF